MKLTDVNIRDPFVVKHEGKYYMYGTRASNFGIKVAGFDVYVSDDLVDWSDPIECFNSEKFGLNKGSNWAPEVHIYNGKFYMFATFIQRNGLRGTFSCVADNPVGPFTLNSQNALTPNEWECLDGTLYISKDNKPYLVFCHEHTQIINGTMCYILLNDDFTQSIGEPTVMFSGDCVSDGIIHEGSKELHYVTDGPFLIRNSKDELLLIWSTFINDKYAECLAKSDNGEIDGNFTQLEPFMKDDGGHGMIFDNNTKFIMHTPNTTDLERPKIFLIEETDDGIRLI